MATLETLEESSQQHEARLNLLTSIAERQQTLSEVLREDLVELRRLSAQTQRLWVNLSRKYGWLEDEDMT